MAEEGCKNPMIARLAENAPNLVIGVDRLDYSKGLGLKFEAFEQMLKNRPEWSDKVTFLQITPKSRSAIAEYAAMEQELDTLSGRINADYGNVLWTPIRFVTRTYSRDMLAGLFRIARVGLVTPLRDGMNLVAKEYVAAQNAEDPGVLVLSEFAGAAADLRSRAAGQSQRSGKRGDRHPPRPGDAAGRAPAAPPRAAACGAADRYLAMGRALHFPAAQARPAALGCPDRRYRRPFFTCAGTCARTCLRLGGP